MYVGRIVSVGRTKDNKLSVMYRVSSRSFPNREIATLENSLAVIPKKATTKTSTRALISAITASVQTADTPLLVMAHKLILCLKN